MGGRHSFGSQPRIITIVTIIVTIIYKVLIVVDYKHLNFFFLQYMIMYIFNRENAVKLMMKDLKQFIFENYYKQIGSRKKISYYSFGRVIKRFTSICY